MNAQNDFSNTDLQEMATATLKTLIMLNRPHGYSTVINILQGRRDRLRKAEQAHFDTFGTFENWGSEYLATALDVLVERHLIEVSDPFYGTLRATAYGKQFLDNPAPVEVAKDRMRASRLAKALTYRLKTFRRNWSEEHNMAPYEVFNNYALRRIVQSMPQTEAELREVPGVTPGLIANHGEDILALMTDARERPANLLREYREYLVETPLYVGLKKQVDDDKSLDEIAELQSMRAYSVETCLEQLHYAGRVDLRNWIERQLPADQLKQGVDFFKDAENARLRDAHAALNMEYPQIRMCRFYALTQPQLSAAQQAQEVEAPYSQAAA